MRYAIAIVMMGVAGADVSGAMARPDAPSAPKSVPDAKAPADAPKAREMQPSKDGAVDGAAAFPHPLIVEVLYAVPTGPSGDANQDGNRHASGDEFVEIVNPHDQPIRLAGYSIADGAQSEKSRMKFTFPSCELAPGAVAVVFNGNGANIQGPVGDGRGAPSKGNEKFGGALVFTMRNTNSRTALGNQGDELTLSAPGGKVIQRLRWGTMAEGAKPDPTIPLEETVPVVTRCSVERTGTDVGASWRPHTEADKRPFSPGEYAVTPKSGE